MLTICWFYLRIKYTVINLLMTIETDRNPVCLSLFLVVNWLLSIVEIRLLIVGRCCRSLNIHG